MKLSDVLPAEPAEPTLRQLRILSRYAKRRWAHLDPDDVESMVGEAWMTAMRKAKTDVPFPNTLLAVLQNLALNASRKHQRRATREHAEDLAWRFDAIAKQPAARSLTRSQRRIAEQLSTAADAPAEHERIGRAFLRTAVPALVGITYRQLDHWERTGRIRSDVAPSGSGSRAVLTERSVIGVAIVAELMRSASGRMPAWDDILAAVDNDGFVEWVAGSGWFGRGDAASWLTIDVDKLRATIAARAAEVAA